MGKQVRHWFDGMKFLECRPIDNINSVLRVRGGHVFSTPTGATFVPVASDQQLIKDLTEGLEELLSYHYHNDQGVKPKVYHKAKALIARAEK